VIPISLPVIRVSLNQLFRLREESVLQVRKSGEVAAGNVMAELILMQSAGALLTSANLMGNGNAGVILISLLVIRVRLNRLKILNQLRSLSLNLSQPMNLHHVMMM
jgi:hypothetical protein